MGYPIRSNIFTPYENPQNMYFKRFPIQAAVLFSTQHQEFRDGFRGIFAHLDQLTGEQVIFFAVLDPPADWVQIAQRRGQTIDLQPLGVSYDDIPLVKELARLFQLEWSELPALIVSHDLWSTDFVTTQTSMKEIQQQLQSLTELAHRNPDGISIRDLYNTLAPVSSGAVLMQRNTHRQLQTDLHHFYNVLDSFAATGYLTGAEPFKSAQYLVGRSQEALSQLRVPAVNRGSRYVARITKLEGKLADASPQTLQEAIEADLLEEAAGLLTVLASVSDRAAQQRSRGQVIEVPIHGLESESRTYVEQSRSLINLYQNPHLPWRIHDCTPAMVGLWKTLEIETNHSVIQVARKAKGIPMPQYYLRFMRGQSTKVDAGSSVWTLMRKIIVFRGAIGSSRSEMPGM
ncbi:MAG: hypothetical protein IPK19_41435 [Chloroflexi bacterium]|nr:hypothetical protein [Chloroflexota bacterium]